MVSRRYPIGGAVTTVEVIVPFAGDCQHRRSALNFITGRYPWPVTIAEGGDPWCKAAAVMPAIARSAAEIVVMADADVWCDRIGEAVDAVRDGAAWAIPHRGVFRLTEPATRDVLAGGAPDLQAICEPAYLGLEGGGIVVARREHLLDVPMDPRFVGWGQEDSSWGYALRTMLGRPARRPGQLVHLWHPPQPRATRKRGSDASWQLGRRYHHALDDPAAMRQLLTEARHALDAPQHSLHDHAPHVLH
jgi:hypothetical protein